MMCENQNVEKKNEEVKVMHSQHARILKEDDEIWISSEDLNTENSSDDDRSKTKHAFKKKLKLKNRKRSSPNIRLQRPSIPSVPSTPKDLDNRLLMPLTDDLNSRSTDESRTSDEEYYVLPPSSECLSKRLSLEDWRPMKGALNIPSIEEAASSPADSTRFVNEAGKFYNGMVYKLKSLKSCSVLRSTQRGELDDEEKVPIAEKSFKYLKNTPEVRQKLEFINKLDEEINETICKYKAERKERLNMEFKMCKDINDYKLSEEKNSEIFLKMCNFQDRLSSNQQVNKGNELKHCQRANVDVHEEMESNNSNNKDPEENNITACSTNFVTRNIFAAKEGVMASLSLTDEEKSKIAELLKDIDNFQMNEQELKLSIPNLDNTNEHLEADVLKKDCDQNAVDGINAFAVSEADKLRMEQINIQIEQLSGNQLCNRNNGKTVSAIKDEEFWRQYALEQSLIDINVKLEKLYASYAEDAEKLKQNLRNDEEMETFNLLDDLKVPDVINGEN